MAGYHNLPQDTAETVDPDGWLHTGDIGNLDERGFLRITDRKKDLFKTSSGKHVAPSIMEAIFKGVCPYASQHTRGTRTGQGLHRAAQRPAQPLGGDQEVHHSGRGSLH